ncbi:MAG TPA: hypothetical protein VFQ53_43585 [Kofleriaceae bacterium]|nr:hypothetical protein [Kofleriaceae bacterium]
MVLRSAIIAGVVLTCGCRDREAPPRAKATGSDPLTAPVAAPEPPRLGSANPGSGSAPALPPTPSANAAFEAQARDDVWAAPTEGEIKRRFGKLKAGAKLDAVECRQDQCRLTIAGTPAAMTQTIADLESARGLHGFAANVLLTTPEKQADGTLVMRAIASFDR